MIGKTNIGKSFGGCIRYVMEKEQAEVLEQSGVRIDSPQMTSEDFNLIRKQNPQVENAVWHTSISFANQDQVTNELMGEVAKEYLKKMGLKDHQYLVVRHKDQKHKHLHIVANRVGFHGEVANDKWYKNRTAQVCDELEKKFGLIVAREQYHSKDQTLDKIPLKHQTKIEIREAIKERLSEGISSMDQLKEGLAREGIETKLQVQSTGRINGISFRKNEIAIKGSAVDRNFSYLKLKRQLESNQQLNRGLEL